MRVKLAWATVAHYILLFCCQVRSSSFLDTSFFVPFGLFPREIWLVGAAAAAIAAAALPTH
jgi:hypothetical protein